MYHGERSRGLATRLKEHRADIMHDKLNRTLVNLVDEKGHYGSETNLSKQQRKGWDSIYIIFNKENIKKRTGDIVWAEISEKVAARNRRRDP